MTLRDAFYAGLRYEAPLEAEDFTYIDIQVDPKDISQYSMSQTTMKE